MPGSSGAALTHDQNGIGSESDIIVSGAGASGLVAAIALARAGYSVVCAGRADTRPNGRTVALFEGSLRFLRSIGAWSRFDDAQCIEAIRIVDDTGTRWPVPPLTLAARDVELAALGANVENDRLVAGLLEQAAGTDNLRLTGGFLHDISFSADRVSARDEAGQTLSARLLVAADGRKSPARIAAGIGARTWTYPQTAVTAFLSHARPHKGVSVEFHTRNGPLHVGALARHAGASAPLVPCLADVAGRSRAPPLASRARPRRRTPAADPLGRRRHHP